MIGVFIEDLAAWMWENNRNMFYSQLINSDTEPSIYGHTILKAASLNVITDSYKDVQPVGSPKSIKYFGQWLMWQIVGAWTDKHKLVDILTFHFLGKEEFYTEIFIYGLINELRNGATKSEAFNKNYSFKSLVKSNHDNWKNVELYDDRPGNMLVYVFRAWDSFYRGFDFTSSIHNAMKWSGDQHLLAAITGAYAEAMYGCGFNLIKRKYQKEDTSLQPFLDNCRTGEHAEHTEVTILYEWIHRMTDSLYLENICLLLELFNSAETIYEYYEA